MATKSDPQAGNTNIKQSHHNLYVETHRPGFTEITQEITNWLRDVRPKDGMLTVFMCHTSASLTIQENADPDVRSDLMDALNLLAPENRSYRHTVEGPDDMPAHIKSMLTSTCLNIPVQEGKLVLGTWQGIYVIEHRTSPHRRRIALHFQGHTL